jgi:hypothetical protein
MMLSIRTGLTVIFAQQIREQAALVSAQTRGKGDLPWNAIQIMNEQNRVVAPVMLRSSAKFLA